MAGAEAEAAKNNWNVVITILDSGGNMVMMHKFDDTQLVSISIAEGKARTALMFKQPSKNLEEAIAAGGRGLRFTPLGQITPIEGGHPSSSTARSSAPSACRACSRLTIPRSRGPGLKRSNELFSRACSR